jgi:hypothetical protein
MPVVPKDFFNLYVLAPYEAWIHGNELCKWKAMATAGGINALVEHAFREANPTDPIGTRAYQTKLGNYRKNLGCTVEHRHIQYVVETYKHVELSDPLKVPGSFDAMQAQVAGAFSSGFGPGYDVMRSQLGFPYDDGASPVQWVPLRATVGKCIDYWRSQLPQVALRALC